MGVNARGGYILGVTFCPLKVCFSTKVSSGNSRLSAMSLRDHVAADPFQQHDHDLPKDGMQDIEMVVVSKRVNLGQERAKHRGMRMCGDVTIDLSCFS
jgi:hypothetical protein